MIHIHIDDVHPIDIDIYVDISMKNFTNSTPKKDILSPIFANDDHVDSVYEYLYDKDKISKPKKNYTLQQILDNVESIQKQYEDIIENSIPSSSPSSSCFIPLKQITKMFKNFKFLRNKTIEQPRKINAIQDKSPFKFGGETLQWFAFPQDHIYENDLIN